jgi:predicted RNase H-like nuclease (RuvC/YqgF family)
LISPDLQPFAKAIRLRERAVKEAKAHHERSGLIPSSMYARATFDAIVNLIREDERERIAAATKAKETNGMSEIEERNKPLTDQTKRLRERVGRLEDQIAKLTQLVEMLRKDIKKR